jgi:plastocyanin
MRARASIALARRKPTGILEINRPNEPGGDLRNPIASKTRIGIRRLRRDTAHGTTENSIARGIGGVSSRDRIRATPGRHTDRRCSRGRGSLNVGAREFSLTPSGLTAPADTNFTVSLKNNGGLTHNFTIQGNGTTGNVTAGGTGNQTFNLPDGTYPFFCSIGNHRQQGMSGTITIGTGTPAPPPPPASGPVEPPIDSTDPSDLNSNSQDSTQTTAGSAPIASVKLIHQRGKGVRVRSRLRCSSANGRCRVSRVLKARVNTRLLTNSAATAKKKTVILSKTNAKIAAGKTRTVTHNLSKRGRKILENTARLRSVKATTRGGDRNGALVVVTKTVTLKVPRVR